MGDVARAIEAKLAAGLSPSLLNVIDESDRHAGHAGSREGGESHFAITIEAVAFAGLGRIARQRLVYRLLSAELAGPVHALSLTVRAPGEN